MSYLQNNGHSNALAEPNSPTLSSVAASIAETISTPVAPTPRTPFPRASFPRPSFPRPSLKEIPERKEGLLPHEAEETMLKTLAEERAEIEEAIEAEERIAEERIPFRVEKNKVFGRYTGQFGPFEMVLRIDIDGFNPLLKVSGDYFLVSGQTKTYFGSFLADGITAFLDKGMIIINGLAKTSWSTSYTRLKITIKQTSVFQALSPVMLQWYHVSTNTPGAMYVCNNTSRAFRTAQLEQDCVEGVTPFVAYNTGSLPSGGPDRMLTINSAYQEAGIDMISSGISNIIPLELKGPEARWSNAELHNAMINHFSMYEEKPEWAIWLLHALEHSYGPAIRGIMFDYQMMLRFDQQSIQLFDRQNIQKHGCAVFYRSTTGIASEQQQQRLQQMGFEQQRQQMVYEQQRQQLYNCIHELGHCFNLQHTWQKSYATPQKPAITDSLSWMNYPRFYPGGQAAFWNAFSFQFDPVEVTHLRHGFRPNLIRTKHPFTMGGLEDVGALFEDNVENNSTLLLQLQAKQSYLLGEPVFLETQLRTTSMMNQQVHNNLFADYGFVTIGIKKPGGEVLMYEPIAHMDTEQEFMVLNNTSPAIYESSYIGFGKNGFIFDQVGTYHLRAVYYHRDGSRIVSDTLPIRVKNPVTVEDNEVADIMLNTDVGYLLSFMGSDAPYLQKANDSLDVLLNEDRYKDHPAALYVRFIKGVNAQRTFKTITADKKVQIRQPNFEWGQEKIRTVIDKSKSGNGFDHLSLFHAMKMLAKSYQRQGNNEAAENTVREITAHFNSLPIRQEKKDYIMRKAREILSTER